MDNLLPLPREITRTGGTCAATFTTCTVCGIGEDTIALLGDNFPGIRFNHVDGVTPTASFGDGELDIAAPDHAEGYSLRVTTDGIQIAGHDPAGLWYGLQTLAQMWGREIPCCEIADWPSIRQRGIQIDLKGYQPRFDRLVEMCRLLARHKINTILLEVEDKYDYACAPGCGVPGAYTSDDLRELSRVCHAAHIQVIPKIQALGHIDYLLWHERYRHLRENDHPFQFCPRNPDAIALWKQMATELMDCFPGHRWFHIGADETGNLGECEVCREFPKADSYVHHVGQCIEHVIESGCTPLMWEDILRNLHDNLSPDELHRTWVLGEKCVLNYWEYGYGGADSDLSMLPKYLDAGMRVWGSSGFTGCGPSWIQNVSVLEGDRAKNIAGWTRAAIENGLEGVIATGWTRIASADPPAEPPEANWLAILYAAESTWCGMERGMTDYLRSVGRTLFGMETGENPLADLLSGDAIATRNADRLSLVRAAHRVDGHEKIRTHFRHWIDLYHGRLGHAMPDYRQNLVRERLEEFTEVVSETRDPYRTNLAEFYEEGTVSEVIESRFGADDDLIADVTTKLERTGMERESGETPMSGVPT
jgi:hypothetical protein